MKIISWNVNGIRAIVKKNFFKDLNLLNPDIICLQETKAQEDEVIKALHPLTKTYTIYVNSAIKKGYSGTTILTKTKPINVNYALNVKPFNDEGRIICLEFTSYYLVNVYTPNSGQKLIRLPDRKKWDNSFLNYITNLKKKKPVIICGDFNVAHQPIDLKNDVSNYNKTAGYTQTEIDGLNQLIKTNFIDTFRYFHPEKVTYSFWSYRFSARSKNIGWRIDYFLVTKNLLDKIKKTEILTSILGSDHCPITLEINN